MSRDPLARPDRLRRRLLSGGAALLAGAAVQAAPQRTLVVAAFPAIDLIVKAAIPAWQAQRPDVEVKIISRRSADHHTAITTALSSQRNVPDVFAVEADYIGRFSLGHGLEDLRAAPYRIEDLRPHFVPFAWQQATNGRGEVVGIPSDIGPGTLLYRHDLLQRAGLAVDNLTTSWEGYVEAGRRIKATTGAYLLSHARDMKNIAIRTGVQAGEGLYFGPANSVLVGSPRFVRAFELAREVRRSKLDARVVIWTSDWSEGFRRGAIATQMLGAWLAGHMNNWLAPTTRGLWRASQLPQGAYAAYGGTFFSMARANSDESKALGWQFARLLTTDRALQLQAFRNHDAFPALVDTFDDPFFDQPLPFLGGQAGRRVWRDAAAHIVAPTIHKQDRFAEEVIDTELDKVLLQDKDIPSALGDAAQLLQHRANR
jgi:multiple sugar transport system substrate-binding protein